MNLLHRARVPAATWTLLALVLAGCGSPGGPGPAAPASRIPASPRVSALTQATSPCAASGGVLVRSASKLTSALAKARPGETIRLAPGNYDGDFVAAASGTPTAPITLCGPRSAVLDGGGVSHGYTLYLDHASWWRLAGFTVEGGQKGIITDAADYDLLYGLFVHTIGDEGIHLRDFSSHDTISQCVIQNTGLLVPFYGEGVYVGSAHGNWCRYTACQPDRSNGDVIEDNDISDTTAENIDIKEGTTGGEIIGNHFDGAGMVSSAATAWVNVKGNDWTVEDNTGVNSIKDGFQVHQVYPGWGIGNFFRANDAQVNGPGYGFFVQNKRLRTVLACDNKVSRAGRGFSTIACTRG